MSIYKDKKSFILYKDSLNILTKMSDEQAGKFIKIIYQYQITGELPELDFSMEMAINGFINQFIRDDEDWLDKKNKASQAGKASANARQQKQRPLTTVENVEQKPTDSTVNVNVTDNVTDKNKKQKTSSDVVFDFSDFSESEVISINEWLDYKKERKESYKQQAGLTKLRNLMLDLKSKDQLIHAIDRSITNSWKGLFEDKNFIAPEDNRTPFRINEKGKSEFWDGFNWREVELPSEILLDNTIDFRLIEDLRK